jgi:putative phosphoesterase
MRVALLSDVHANLVALQAVLGELDRQGIERIYHAGDIVGYYPFPNETIQEFRRRGIVTILGNHDRAALNANAMGMTPMASTATRWTARRLDPDSIAYLRTLRPSLDVRIGAVRTSMFHGSPRDDDEYIYQMEADEALLEMCGSRLLVLGHTHVPYVVTTSRGTIVNPGSVGQPRDGDPRSSFMIYDSTKDSFEHRRVAYDIKAMEAAVYRAGLPDELSERLWQGV